MAKRMVMAEGLIGTTTLKVLDVAPGDDPAWCAVIQAAPNITVFSTVVNLSFHQGDTRDVAKALRNLADAIERNVAL